MGGEVAHRRRPYGWHGSICPANVKIRPAWMGLTRQREIDDDPREYVKFRREFIAGNKIPLADAFLRDGQPWRQGIPCTTLMKNTINHPAASGKKILAGSPMALFP